jgi:hypothetical protein
MVEKTKRPRFSLPARSDAVSSGRVINSILDIRFFSFEEAGVSHVESDKDRFLWRLQCQLPLSAHGRPALTAFLRNRIANIKFAPHLKVTNVFHSGAAGGLMYPFLVEDSAAEKYLFVAPVEQLAFDRRYPNSREIALCRRRVRQG